MKQPMQYPPVQRISAKKLKQAQLTFTCESFRILSNFCGLLNQQEGRHVSLSQALDVLIKSHPCAERS